MSGLSNAEADLNLTNIPSAQELIEQLNLEPHIEGGYFRRTFQADHRNKIATEYGDRYSLTSIYYLLTADSPIGHWHLNKSDILHFYHLGSPVTYFLITPSGDLQTVILGPDPSLGHQLQMAVKGGTWKASTILTSDSDLTGRYGLISEAVAPGFDYRDMTLADEEALTLQFPEHAELITRYARKTNI